MSAGIRMQQRSVPAAELQSYLLSGQHVVIALVDKSILESGLALWSEPSYHPRDPPGYKGRYRHAQRVQKPTNDCMVGKSNVMTTCQSLDGDISLREGRIFAPLHPHHPGKSFLDRGLLLQAITLSSAAMTMRPTTTSCETLTRAPLPWASAPCETACWRLRVEPLAQTKTCSLCSCPSSRAYPANKAQL